MNAASRDKQHGGAFDVDFSCNPGEELANKDEFRDPPLPWLQCAWTRKRFVNAEKRERKQTKYFVSVETKQRNQSRDAGGREEGNH